MHLRPIRRPLFFAVILSFFLVFIPHFAGAQAITVPNFSFETPTTTTNINDPTGASWTFTNGGGRFTGVAKASLFGGSAPDGSQMCYLQSTSSISQSLSGFVPGATYAVTVAGGIRPGTAVDGVNVTVNGATISSFTPSVSTYTDYTATFVATSSSETIGFVGTIATTNEANLDNVRINQVATSISIGNFSFETPTTTTNINDPTGASWTFTNGGGRFAGIGRASQIGGSAPDGTQVCYLQSTSSISQSLSGFVPGVTYAVTVAGGIRPGTAVDSVNATVNGATIYSFTPTLSTYLDYPGTFVATSSSETLGFVGTTATTNEANLDNVRISLLPTTPSNLVATPGIGQIALSWSASAGAISYNVYRGTTSGGEGTTAYATGLTGTTYVDTSTTPSTTYYYEVLAVTAPGSSGLSNEASATVPPSAPTAFTAIPRNGQVSLTWTGSTGATSYSIYRGTTSGGEGSTAIASNVTGAAYNDSTVTNGTNYFYKVAAVNAGGTGAKSTEASATPSSSLPLAPNGVRAQSQAYNGSITVYWNTVATATSYSVYRSTTPGGEGAVRYASAGSNTYFNDTSVTSGTTYYYEVSATNSFGEGATSVEVSATAGSTPLSAPPNLKAVAGSALVTLNWGSVTGAASYNLYRGGVVYAQNITSPTFVDNAVTNGVNYSYYVTAVNVSGEGSQSNTVNATPGSAALAAPTGMHADSNSYGGPSQTVGWNAVSGATTYNVYRSTTPGGEGAVPYAVNVSSTSYSDPSYVSGTMYYYKTAAVNSTGEGTLSTEVSVLAGSTQLAAPANILARPGNNQVTVIWTPTANATSYNVYRSGPAGVLITTNITGTSFVDTGLTNGASYSYQVAGVCTNGEGMVTGFMGRPATAVPGTVLPAGPTLSVVNSCGVNLSWTAVSGAYGYNLYRSSTPGGEGAVPCAWNIPTTTYTDPGAIYSSGTPTYYYTLSVVNSSGDSPQGPELADTLQSVFTMTSLPTTVNVTRGTLGNTAIRLNTTCSNGDTVTLGIASSLPSGLTAWVTPFPETVTNGAVSAWDGLNAGMKTGTLYLCPSSTMSTGQYTVTVSGTGASGLSSVNVTVNIQ